MVDFEDLTEGARRLGAGDGLTERAVLGGRGLYRKGRLLAAAVDDGLCLPVDGGEWPILLDLRGAEPLRFAGRPVPGWLVIEAAALATEETLDAWLRRSTGIA